MTETIIQILTTFALILGVAGGETVSSKVFGLLKKSWHYLVEIAIFVLIMVIILNTIVFTEFESVTVILSYFAMGFGTIITIRAGISGFGFLTEHIKNEILKTKEEEDFIIGLKKSLERRGIAHKEIFKISKEIGFSQNKINKTLGYFGIAELAEKPKKKRIKRKTKKKHTKR